MRSVALVLVLAATACAAPSYVGHTGRVTPKGAIRVAVGSGYHLNASAADVLRDGRDLARNLRDRTEPCPEGSGAERCWRAEVLEPVVDAAFRFALAAPLASHTELSGRYGLGRGLDLGVHVGPDSRGIEAGWQAFGPLDPGTDGWAGTFLLSYGRRSLGTLGAAIETVFRGEAGLDDYELAFVAGRQWRELAHAYVGGRYLLTRWSLQVIPDLPVLYETGEVGSALLGTDRRGTLHHVGAVIGGALGYRRVFAGAELNLLQVSGTARILSRERDLSGFGIMPAVYLFVQL